MDSHSSVRGRVAELLRGGATPVDAAETVLDEAPDRWPDWRGFFRPLVFRLAQDMNNAVVNDAARVALGAGQGQSERRRAAALRRLRECAYYTPTGERVLWDDLTVDLIDVRIALLRKQVGSMVEHLGILEAARKLCADRGVDRLGDIDGWEDLVRAALAASGGVGAGFSGGAREPRTSGNEPRDTDGIDDEAAGGSA